MKAWIPIIAASVLASCAQGNDPKVCTPIIEPSVPSDPVQAIEGRQTLEWSKAAAEACLHRNAYRLAPSSDQAEIVARAAVQACEGRVDNAVSYRRKLAFDQYPNDPLAERLAEADRAEAAARKSWSEFALLKVVEGRAGRCKPD